MAGKRRDPRVVPVPLDVLRSLDGKRRVDGSGARKLDVFLARLATRQCGVVGRKQLVALGFTGDEIDYRVATRRLIRVYQGVYAVGHEALSDRARVIAGLLAAGPAAAASHRTAGAIWRVLPSMPQFIEVTLTDRVPRQRAGLKVHQAQRLDTTTHQGLLVTTPLQTLEDLNDDRAWSEALYLGLIDRSQAPSGTEPTRSELERALLPALRKAELPAPTCDHQIGRYRADFFWPDHRLVVETDGWQGHGHRAAFEDDRTRDAWLQASGYTVVRFTWRQVMGETLLVTVRIAQLLARTPHHALDTPPAGG
jgi:very-short-patch-repair endonuclease